MSIKILFENGYPRKWEAIDPITDRLAVPGGWIIRLILEEAENFAASVTFFPDPSWTWKLEPTEEK